MSDDNVATNHKGDAMSGTGSAESVLSTARSYQPACVLAAAADLELFDIIGDQEVTARAVAREASTDPRATAALLDALTTLKFLDKRGDTYRVVSEALETLTSEGPRSVLAMVQHQANCLRRWAQLSRVVKTGRPAERTPSIRGAEADTAAFISAMDNVSGPVADQVVKDIGPLSFEHVLDVGGASGTWTVALLRRYPDATATVFDLPDVIPMARGRLAKAGLEDRVNLVGGDFEEDPLPRGADLAWVSAIIHQNSREQNRRLLQAVNDALSPGGQALIRDVVMAESRTSPPSGVLFAINMLVNTEGGGTFTFEEIRQDLESAGFHNVRMLRQDDGMNSVVAAEKPR